MFNTENLLRNEVFPAELPPCFSTDDLAANATLAIATSNSFGQGYSIPLTYSGYKSESSRRKFALPNPYHYCKAVDFIVKNESQIKAILEKSKYSLTAPIERQPRQEQPYAKRSNTVLDINAAENWSFVMLRPMLRTLRSSSSFTPQSEQLVLYLPLAIIVGSLLDDCISFRRRQNKHVFRNGVFNNLAFLMAEAG